MHSLVLQFQGQYQISEDEIRSSVPDAKMQSIKETDKTPQFAAYIVAQEGISTPKIMSGNSKPIIWMREKMAQVVQAIKPGIQLFWNHNKDNSTNYRSGYGEVVASFEREINGKASAIAVAYIPPGCREKVKQFDVLSMEAVVSLVDKGAELVADFVKNITGLAVGSSKDWVPAFEGARQIAMIQAQHEIQALEKETKMPEPLDPNNIPFAVIVEAVKAKQIFPNQLYSKEQIFGKAVKTESGKVKFMGGDAILAEQAESYFSSFLDEKLEQSNGKLKEYETQIETLSKEKKQYFNKAIRQEYLPQLKEKAMAKKFTPNAIKLLELETKNIEIPENEDERVKLGDSILAAVEEKHKELFGDTSEGEKPPAATAGENTSENPFIIK